MQRIGRTGVVRCRRCDVPDVRIDNDEWERGQRVYRNPAGRRWSGMLCPACHQDDINKNCRKRRAKARRANGIKERAKTGGNAEYRAYRRKCQRRGLEPLALEAWLPLHGGP